MQGMVLDDGSNVFVLYESRFPLVRCLYFALLTHTVVY